MILAIFLVSLLTISAVSAEDNATSDVVRVYESNDVGDEFLTDSSQDDDLCVDGDDFGSAEDMVSDSSRVRNFSVIREAN